MNAKRPLVERRPRRLNLDRFKERSTNIRNCLLNVPQLVPFTMECCWKVRTKKRKLVSDVLIIYSVSNQSVFVFSPLDLEPDSFQGHATSLIWNADHFTKKLQSWIPLLCFTSLRDPQVAGKSSGGSRAGFWSVQPPHLTMLSESRGHSYSSGSITGNFFWFQRIVPALNWTAVRPWQKLTQETDVFWFYTRWWCLSPPPAQITGENNIHEKCLETDQFSLVVTMSILFALSVWMHRMRATRREKSPPPLQRPKCDNYEDTLAASHQKAHCRQQNRKSQS